MLDSLDKNSLSMTINLSRGGRYALAFRYANGSGSLTGENKCAIRTLFLDGAGAGAMVFPQRGQDQWDNWGMSNQQVINLSAGIHRVELRMTPQDNNMNLDVNRVAISSLILVQLD